MRAGLLDKLIGFRAAERTTDAFGARRTEWESVLTGVPARVSYGRMGFGTQQGEQVYSSAVWFTIRYNGKVSEYQRVSWDGRLYRITGIERYPGRGEMRIQAELMTQD